MLLAYMLAYDPRVDTLVSLIDTQLVGSFVRTLQNFYTRSYTSDSALRVAQYIYDRFLEFGADTVFYQIFFYGGKQQRNVVARFYGDSMHLPRIIVGAHHDSRPYDGYAPGADDNASGVSLLLSLAYVLRFASFVRTVELVAFAAEEPGLVGSDKYAQKLYSENDSFLLYINADMIGGDIHETNNTVIVERDEGNAVSSNDSLSWMFADSLASTIQTYTNLNTTFGPIFASDYMPFEQRGYVCIGVFEYNWNSTYHSEWDVVDSMDLNYATEVVRGVSAFVLELASVRSIDSLPAPDTTVVPPEDSTTAVHENNYGNLLYMKVYSLDGKLLGKVSTLHNLRRGVYIVEYVYERARRFDKFVKRR